MSHNKRIILGSAVLAVVISGGLIYRQYQRDMALAYGRISSGGKMIETACGPIQYTEFGEGPPMLIVHGAGGGYDQGAYFAKGSVGIITGLHPLVLGSWVRPSQKGLIPHDKPIPTPACWIRWELIVLVW